MIDLTLPLVAGQPAFPGDPVLAISPHETIAKGKYNVSQVTMGTHQGTHLDAMYHFLEDGRTIDQMPLDWFYGPAHVLRLPRGANGEITREDLLPFEPWLKPEAKILIATGWAQRVGASNYFTEYPSLTLEAGRYLAERRIRLLGMDMPSPSQQWYEMHHILLHREVEMVLVEGLVNLDAVSNDFIFIGFPLNFKGRDGSPIRAVAVCEDYRAFHLFIASILSLLTMFLASAV